MPKSRSTHRSEKRLGANAFRKLASGLAEAGRAFYARGWVLGTSGNFSGVMAREPLRLAITASGVDKGTLTPRQFLEIDHTAQVLRGSGSPSAEALLHLTLARVRGAGAVCTPIRCGAQFFRRRSQRAAGLPSQATKC